MRPDDPDYNPDRDEERPEQYDGFWTPDDLPEDNIKYEEYLRQTAQVKEEAMTPDYKIIHESPFAEDENPMKHGVVVLDEAPARRAGNNKGTNRYTYRVGVVQQVIREVVKHPNKWVLARRDSANRSSLAPTLSKYKQLRWRSRKNDNGLFDIWVSYTPNPDGSMDGLLDADIQSWNAREVEGRDRPDIAG